MDMFLMQLPKVSMILELMGRIHKLKKCKWKVRKTSITECKKEVKN
jgi:hypothetical protein